jgi:peptidoglycan/LPS O-acetylase OafA/YrhL
LVATIIWLPVTAWVNASTQIGAAGAYVLNWVLASESVNYFTAGSTGTPVTHYWSLSVEEQFYIVWPLIIIACFAASTRLSPRARNRLLLSAFTLILVGSFCWALFSTATQPSAAYFQTTGRAWEFAAGGILTFARRPVRPARLIPVAWIAWASFAAAAVAFGPLSGFPGVSALVPVVATVAIIWIGDVKHITSPSVLTSLRPVQFLGDVSYSVYLWHWPLIFLAPYVLGHPLGSGGPVVIIIVTIALAYLSKRFVEDPVRLSRTGPLSRPRWVLIATAAGVAVLLVAASAVSANVSTRTDTAAQTLYRASTHPGDCFGAQSELSGATCTSSHVLTRPDDALVDVTHQIKQFPNGTSCESEQGSPTVHTCSFGAKQGSQTVNVALVGDSHAEVWASALALIAESKHLRVTTYLEAGCPPTLDDSLKYTPQMSPGINEGCRTWRDAVIRKVTADSHIDVVITSSKNLSYTRSGDGAADDGDGYVRAWNQWLDAGKKVIVIGDVPDRVVDIPGCIAKHTSDTDPCTAPAESFSHPGPLQSAAGRITSDAFAFVDIHNVFCDADVCHSVIGGIPAYVDPSHITAAFARSFAPLLAKLPGLKP